MGGQVVRYQDQQALAQTSTEITDLQQLGSLIAKSGFFQDAREMAQAAVKVMAGKELGIPPIASMMGINIIKGKVAMGAHLMASRIRAHGYDFTVIRLDNSGCTLEFLGKADDKGKRKRLGESSFTEEDAKAAQVFSDMYKKYPRNMYYSRAVSNGVKWYCPEVTAGAPVYTPEELGEEVDADGEIVRATPKPEDIAQRRIAEEKAKLEAVVAEKETPAKPKDTVATFKVMLEKFAELKARVGNEIYYRILGAEGYEHANQIPSLQVGRRVYAEIEMAASDPAPNYVATDDDVPDFGGER